MKIQSIDVKLFLSIGLTITGFLMSITAFTQVYKRHSVPYPEIKNISSEVLPKIQETNFIAVWDIMLSRNVARHAKIWGGGLWIWEKIWEFLRSSDFVFWNLEWTTNGTDIFSYQKTLTFNALPELIETLPKVGFEILNLANNHALDQWNEGLTITQKLLKKIGIQNIGVGEKKDEAWEPKIIEKNNIKIAFIWASYTSYNDDGTRVSERVARMQETNRLKESLRRAKRDADIVVVTMHAWTEYTLKTTPLQESFARTAIDNGADIVIGAHPHWIQPIERYQWKYIFYSLGNFVFDQEFSPETKEWLTLKISIQKNTEKTHIKQIELIPIIIESYGQPRLTTEEEKDTILKKIWEKDTILR